MPFFENGSDLSKGLNKPPFLAGLMMGSLVMASISAGRSQSGKQAVQQAIIAQLEVFVAEIPVILEDFLEVSRERYEQRLLAYVSELEESMGFSSTESEQFNSMLRSMANQGEQLAKQQLREANLPRLVLNQVKKFLK